MNSRGIEVEEFIAKRETLEHPEDADVREAFARLPKRGSIEMRCRWERRMELQRLLVDMGAFAICLRPLAGFQEVLITALKGKMGACYETGRSAAYHGAAHGVMDDDHHLIVGTIRVCEKTGGLYTLPPYQGLLTVTDADSKLLARLETDPVPFDCNTFEPDAERLAALPFMSAQTESASTTVCYPGPFSLLVSRDGSILRRGHCTAIRSDLVGDLHERDGLIAVPDRFTAEAEQPINYPTAHRRMGAGCLLAAEVATAQSSVPGHEPMCDGSPVQSAHDALRGISNPLRRRLARLVERNEPYLVLTGSDPKDVQGCCPNTQVGEANRLVAAGVLSSYRENAPADSCTTTIYAFAGEIAMRDNRPEFTVNTATRAAAAAALRHVDRGCRSAGLS